MCRTPDNGDGASSSVHDVAAILDFTDAVNSYVVMDVAIAIVQMSIHCPYETQLDVGGHILSGYYKYSTLNEAEKKSLKTLMCARLCQCLVFGAHAYAKQPWNDYILTTSRKGRPLLQKLWEIDHKELYRRWDSIIDAYKH